MRHTIIILLALLSACSPPPKPYAPAAKSPVAAEVLEATPDTAPAWGKAAVPTSKVVPADRLVPENPRINELKVGESCIVTSLSYRVDAGRALWIHPKDYCAAGRTIFEDILVTRIHGGYTAKLLGDVSGHPMPDELKNYNYERVLEIIP